MKPYHKAHFLSLIVPVYRQEKTIVRDVRQIQSVLETIRYRYEIIVIVDGVIDNSYQVVKNAKIKHVRCYRYKKNYGKSYVIRVGMNKSKGDYVMFLDAGMEIDPNGISMLLEHMEWYNADIIVGSKRHLASQINYPLSRKILSNGYYYLVKLMFGIKIHDTQAGIKVFKKIVLKKILPRLVEKKYAGDLEILVAANSAGYTRIYEAPIKMDYTASSITSAGTLKAIVGIFIDTLAIFYRKNILRHY